MKWAILLLLLAGCTQGEKINNAPVAGDIIFVPAYEWHVVDAATLSLYYANSGETYRKGDKLEGFTGLGPDGRVIVFTTPPKYVDDQVTMTVGHENLHLALGAYHAEHRR